MIFKDFSINLCEINCYALLFEGAIGLHRMLEKNTTSLPMLFSLDLQFFFYVHKILGLLMVLKLFFYKRIE
jgi:hypothetical protein